MCLSLSNANFVLFRKKDFINQSKIMPVAWAIVSLSQNNLYGLVEKDPNMFYAASIVLCVLHLKSIET